MGPENFSRGAAEFAERVLLCMPFSKSEGTGYPQMEPDWRRCVQSPQLDDLLRFFRHALIVEPLEGARSRAGGIAEFGLPIADSGAGEFSRGGAEFAERV